MSYIRMAPQVVTTDTHTCQFHKDHPTGHWAGCTCSVSVSSRDKRPDEMTDAERRFMADPYPGAYIPPQHQRESRWTASQGLRLQP